MARCCCCGRGLRQDPLITHRIAYLIEERGVPADSILAVTFTNKAATEMAERVDRILGHSSLAKPLLSTFHSFCVRVLRRDIEALRVNGKASPATRHLRRDDQEPWSRPLKRLAVDDKQLKPRVRWADLVGEESHDRSAGVLPRLDQSHGREDRAHLRDLSQGAVKANALDFDDLLLEAVRLLKVAPKSANAITAFPIPPDRRIPGHQPPQYN